MIEEIKDSLKKASIKAGIKNPTIKLEHPEDSKLGDFSSNVAMVHAKELNVSPKSLAEMIVGNIEKKENIAAVEVAGPGFINIKISDSFFANEIINIAKDASNYGKTGKDSGKKIMVEYTDPNPFKVFHIGHLMANAIGESISRIVEFSGANVIRACYQGDVGLHVAKTIWAITKTPSFNNDIKSLGEMYVFGSQKYEDSEVAKKEIVEINKKVFERSDEEINKIYDDGRKISLEYFDEIYKKLNTRFSNFFFESEVAEDGIKIVKEFLKKGIFEESEGAIIFPGEKYGQHTRVFINSQGLPTYEAKELGLTKAKFEKYPNLDESIIVTANEQDAYYKVIFEALRQIFPEIYTKTKHISHGILRPSTGKMSSRKGNVVSVEDLISEFSVLVDEKIKDREFSTDEKSKILNEVAIAGIKYTILRQAIGSDIIYDPTKAVSFDGDSGPYLQYATVRAQAVLNKIVENKKVEVLPTTVDLLEKLIARFPEVTERARAEYAPHYIVTYLIELAGAFNAYYAHHKIIDDKDPLSTYRLTLTKVFVEIMRNGLWLLAIKVPERM